LQVRLESIGCRLNIGEIEAMARGLAKAGHRVVGPGTPAELCILNTCTVTAIASRKSRQLIRQLKKTNPSAAVIVTGCDAELSPSEMVEIGVDLVVGNAQKERLLELAEAEGLLDTASTDPDDQELFEPGDSTRTRAFLKVQDGCDNRCTFCVITIARGVGRSVPADAIMEELNELQRLGYREVVLSGVHLGSYGHDLGDQRGLQHLVERALAERLRRDPQTHGQAHQSCRVLSLGSRRSPGRARSRHFLRHHRRLPRGDRRRVRALHHSCRGAGLFAAPHLPLLAARRHTGRKDALAADLERRFNSGLVGHTVDVLWETAEDHGDALRWSGLTPNYVRVTATTTPDEDLLNVVTPTTITDVVPGGLVGRILNSEFEIRREAL